MTALAPPPRPVGHPVGHPVGRTVGRTGGGLPSGADPRRRFHLELLRRMADPATRWWTPRQLGASAGTCHSRVLTLLAGYRLVERRAREPNRDSRRLTQRDPGRATKPSYEWRLTAVGRELLTRARPRDGLVDALARVVGGEDAEARDAAPTPVPRAPGDRAGRVTALARGPRQVLLTLHPEGDGGRTDPDVVALRGTKLAAAEARFGRVERWFGQWCIYRPHLTRGAAAPGSASTMDRCKYVGPREGYVDVPFPPRPTPKRP